ncbi:MULTISPECIES: hydrolase [Bacillaceae]|uniref:hydrolase n=1 Tax=Bacillaceae TaxID=186817 RepID=UPI000E72FD25|nr:hydrolase [Bacillus sp. PK3_68]RJS60082.1 hydrolase [Bacillus sp. PK3_68]
MEEEKNEYYISLANGEIMRQPTVSPWNFKIYATDVEITELRELFDANYTTEWANFFRAHIPYREYHKDKENDQYDEHMEKIYKIIYKLGDEEAKQYVKEVWEM